VLCCGEDDGAFRRRAKAIGHDPDELRANAAAGTVAEVVDRLGAFGEAGAERIYLQVLDLADLDHLRLIAAEVAPALA
jgi:2-methylisocitrate lyase-like PEP mutase family enzyme